MGIMKSLLMPLIKRKIVKEGGLWAEEINSWGISEWKTYQSNRFDLLKKNKWTSKAFPSIQDITYEDLPNFNKTLEYPTFPEDFPTYKVVFSTGTIKRKLIKFTKDDMFFIARSVTGEFQRASNSIGKVVDRHFLALVGGEAYVSGSLANIASLFMKKVVSFDPIQMKKNYHKIMKLAPFNGVMGIQAFILVFLEQLTENIFEDDLWIIGGGDILSPTVQRFIFDKISELGDIDVYLIDVYGCSEGVIMALSMEFLDRNTELVLWPDMNIMTIEKENGEMINILDAKPGDTGVLYLTPMFTFMIPNYRLGDIVQVTGYSHKFKLPKIKVLGRETYKVSLKHPTLGEISGVSGAHLRIFGIPFNTWAFDEFMSNLTTNYMLIIEKEGNKALFKLYIDRKIEKDFLIKQFENNMELYPIYLGIITNVIDIEIYPQNVSQIDVFFSNWRGGQLKIPKIIVKSEAIIQSVRLTS